MKKCKFCFAEMEDDANVCPCCGKDTHSQKDSAPMRHFLYAFAVLAVVLVLTVAFVIYHGQTAQADAITTTPSVEFEAEPAELPEATVPADGSPDDATCKGTYTAADEDVIAAGSTVIAVTGEHGLTVSQFQAFYWMEVRNFLSQYGAYAAYFGLDSTLPLDTQICSGADPEMTWQQYFVSSALNAWHSYIAMSDEADANGYQLPEEQQLTLDTAAEDLRSAAEEYGFESYEDMIHDSLGAAASLEDYVNFITLYYKANGYYNQLMEQIELTDEALEAFFDEHSEGYEASGITKDSRFVDVRHVLLYPEGADGTNIFTEEFPEEAWLASEEAAKKLLAAWAEGDASEERFAAMANEHSQDPGSNQNGGLYTDVTEGEMVQAFNDWCFDPERQAGDTGIVRTDYGFHIMYFSGSRPMWKEYAEIDYTREQANNQVLEIEERTPMTVDYSKILLALTELA